MVHVEDAAIAARAVMATLRLEYVAHQAVSAPFVLRVAQVKSPENGHLAGVGGHGLDEAPDEHEEEHVEDGEQNDYSPIICRQSEILASKMGM